MKQPVEIHSQNNMRLRLFYIVYGVLFLILIGGLSWRQLYLNKIYIKKEEQQSLRRVLQPGPRGNIYDRNGKLLVGNKPRFSVVAYLGELRKEFRKEYLQRVRDLREKDEKIDYILTRKEAHAAVLQRYLDKVNAILGRHETINIKELDRHYSQRLLLPMPLIQDLTLEEYAKLIEQLPVEYPLQIYTDNIRYYPYGASAAHTLGYVVSTFDVSEVGVPGKNLTTLSIKGKEGKTGLEKYFDDILQGESGGEVWLVDPVGFQYECIDSKAPKQGKSITTSLDIDLQRIAEDAMKGEGGAVIVIDIKTGEVLVLASEPSYNLNDLTPYISNAVYQDIAERGAWLNRATQGLYPPGSPFKILTAIACMRHGDIDLETTMRCEGVYDVGSRKFPCDGKHVHGLVNLSEALRVSCNTFFFKYSLETGINFISQEVRRFGFGERTGIELPYEAKGTLVPDPAWKKRQGLGNWLGGDTANVSIGQGYLLVTPLQMACFMAAFARQETWVRPTLIHDDPCGKKYTVNGNNPFFKSPSVEPIGLSDEEYGFFIQGMENAVQSGTARRVYLPNVRIAAKTGTAQIRVQGEKKTLAWFLGFAPIEDPEIAVVVMIDGSKMERFAYGGAVATPIAKPIFKKYFEDREYSLRSKVNI